MKVVLCDHVDHLGERGEIVNVAPGFARNYLLPKKLAMVATPGNMKVLEQRRRRFEVAEAREVGEAQEMAARLAAVSLKSAKKSGEGGTLYGSVTTMEIAELLEAKGITVDRRRIAVAEPIKQLGDHEVTIRLYRNVVGTVQLEVIGEDGRTAADVAAEEAARAAEAQAADEADRVKEKEEEPEDLD